MCHMKFEFDLWLSRGPACTKNGQQQRYKLEFSKSAGTYIVKPIKEPKKLTFQEELLHAIEDRCSIGKHVYNLLIITILNVLFYFLMVLQCIL